MNDTASLTESQTPRQRSQIAITVDNLLRRRLRVSNPRDAREIADGLRRLFRTDDEAQQRESSGLPIVRLPAIGPAIAGSGPSSTELQQARDDIERDLTALTSNSQLKDIEAELDGWGQSIRAIADDGFNAARLALDPRARDRVFGARRQFGDYARMARLIGAMTSNLSPLYRRLAQSLDAAAAIMLVLLGEGLASLGMGSGRALLAVPASELTARRDAVINALRNLTGATENSLTQDTWPYGMHGLRAVLARLEASGHADLRALLDENTLAHVLDDLVDRASAPTPRGLRALSATAQVTVQRLQRLIAVLSQVARDVDPETPPVAAFIEALQLLVDGFSGDNAGYRLLFIARPPLVFYGLYGLGGPDPATRRLLDVVALRGRLAELLDCYLGCDCCGAEVLCQALLDKLLYDTDRAIDLLALGTDAAGNGEPEQRAAAYGWLIDRFLQNSSVIYNDQASDCLSRACAPAVVELRQVLSDLRFELLEVHVQNVGGVLAVDAVGTWPMEERRIMQSELCLQEHSEETWEDLVGAMAPSCTTWNVIHAPIADLLDVAIDGLLPGEECPVIDTSIPPTVETGAAGSAYLRTSTGIAMLRPRDQLSLAVRRRVRLGLPPNP